MRVLWGSWIGWPKAGGPTSLTIGVLDGVHRGHRALIEHLSPAMTRTVLTFEPHPIEVLRPGTPPRLITTIPERVERLEALGVDQVGVLDLSEVQDLGPEEFVRRVLVDTLSVGQVVVGADFRFGKDRTGDIATLIGLGDDHGYQVVVIDLVGDRSGVVSSSRIREMIETGRVVEAEAAMGARFTVTNTVLEGDGRGRDLGFPTANLRPPERKVVPGIGVYAAFAHIGAKTHQAAVSVGVRPTFGGGELLIEAHLLDFDRDLYGEELTIEFVEYLRPELSFDGVGALVAAMEADVSTARRLLEAAARNVG